MHFFLFKGWGSKENLYVLRCVCACVCTHVHIPSGEIILLDDLGLLIKHIYNYTHTPLFAMLSLSKIHML